MAVNFLAIQMNTSQYIQTPQVTVTPSAPINNNPAQQPAYGNPSNPSPSFSRFNDDPPPYPS